MVEDLLSFDAEPATQAKNDGNLLDLLGDYQPTANSSSNQGNLLDLGSSPAPTSNNNSSDLFSLGIGSSVPSVTQPVSNQNLFDLLGSSNYQPAQQPAVAQPSTGFDFLNQSSTPLKQPNSSFDFLSQPVQAAQTSQMTSMFGGLNLSTQAAQPVQPPVFSQPSSSNMFGGLHVKGGQAAQSTVKEPEAQPQKPNKPKDAWELGKDLIKF